MKILIDFEKKGPGYKEALQKFMAKRPVPIYTEFRHPEGIDAEPNAEKKLQRMNVIIDERVCGQIIDMQFNDTNAVATLELHGPLKYLLEEGQFSIGARMLTTGLSHKPKYIREIANLDILPIEEHIDYQVPTLNA